MQRKKERLRGAEEPPPPSAKQKKPPSEDVSSKAVARSPPAAAGKKGKKAPSTYWREPAFTTVWEELSPTERASAEEVRVYLCAELTSAQGLQGDPSTWRLSKEDIAFATKLVRCKALFKTKQDVWFQYMTALLVYPWNTLTKEQAPWVWRLIPLLNYTEEADVDFLIDDDLKELFTAIGPLAVQPLFKFIQDTSRDNRDLAAETLAEIADQHPLYKRPVIELLLSILRKWKDESDILNGYIVSALCDLSAAEALPLMRKAYEGSAVDEDVAGDWSEVLEALDEPLRAGDPLVAMCKHCERPALICRKEVEALRAILGEKASAEGAQLFEAGMSQDAMQRLLMAYTYYPWHLDERYAFPLLQCMRERGLYEEVLHLSVEFLRYHHFTRDKERALFRLLRAEMYEMLGRTKEALAELQHVQTALIPQALDGVRERIEAHNANKERNITQGFDAVAAKNARVLSSFRTVTLSSPLAFHLSAPCCAQLRHHAISALSDRQHFAYASSCHTVSVRKANEAGEAVFVVSEEPSVVALEGDELATANIFSFQISIFQFKKSGHVPTHRLVGHCSTVLALQMSPMYIVSCASADVRVWNRASKQPIRNLWGHRGPIASLRVHGDSCITASETVLIEHTLSTGGLRRMFLGHEAAVQTVDFNTHIVISCDAHTTALLHDRQSGVLLRTLQHDGLCAVSSSLIALRSDTYVELLDLEGDLVANTPLPSFVTDLALWDDEKDGGYFTAACLEDITPRIVRVPFFSKKDDSPVQVVHCHQCKITEAPSFKACGSCKSATYCSAECQRTHWPTHKLVCTPRTTAVSASTSPATSSNSNSNSVPHPPHSHHFSSHAVHNLHPSCAIAGNPNSIALASSPPLSSVHTPVNTTPPHTPPRSDTVRTTNEPIIASSGTSSGGAYTDPE